MQRFVVSICVVVCMMLMGGCSVHHKNQQLTYAPQVYSHDAQAPSRGKRHSSLQRQYSKWQGTPYRYGGASRQGIDCSALMMHVFNEAFGAALPRTTAQQMKLGQLVAQSRLQVGDLVFFKIGRNQRHVGVFMGGDEFLHASVSDGVTISHLDDPYWRSRYWQSRRIL